jgi:hypothetical protein
MEDGWAFCLLVGLASPCVLEFAGDLLAFWLALLAPAHWNLLVTDGLFTRALPTHCVLFSFE